MNRRELEMRFDELFEGRLKGEEFAQLQAELRSDPGARAAYREALHLEHALRFRAKGVDMLHVVPMEKVVERRNRRMLRHALSAAAALVVLSGVTMALILTRTPAATLTFDVSPGTKWMMSHVESGEAAPDGHAMEPGSRLVVEHGVVELEFASGVRGIVRGPADLTLRRENLVDLGHGRVWFEVPKKAVGFQVCTPDLVLTDLGTAFGILSKDNFLDEVHVFAGEVEVLHRRGLRHQTRLEADHARAAGPAGRWKEIPLRPGDFLTELPDKALPPIVVDDTATFTSSPNNEIVRQNRFRFSVADLAGFDPQASDKLVVTLSHERGMIQEVTYGGVRMTRSVVSTGHPRLETAIYHLDAPGAAGDLVVRLNQTANGIGGSLLALSNTALGGPEGTASSNSTQLRMSLKSAGCLVVASHVFNDHEENTMARAVTPLETLFSGPTGSSTGCSGYDFAESAGVVEVAFTGQNDRPKTVAAAFAPKR